ncbi:MAG: GNAT family protein [Clostridia bacterium]|nr:GNAT family protein [Clostridia bacterium]MDO5302658.1 GNAT family protein [Clostridia bacterium]
MESKNIILRETIFDDCRYFADWESRPEVTEFFTMDEGRCYEDIVTEYVRYNLDPTKKQLTITLKPGGAPIGRVYLSRINRAEDSLDVTRIYIADLDNRHKGYGEEALRLVLQYAFIDLHMERVTIDHFEKNKIAATLYENIGFKNEGLMRNAGKKDGKYVNLQLKSMLRAEYYDKIHK